jgi:4-amino-4-deoxy-L-arabinose transferase-like glycosyltransferase
VVFLFAARFARKDSYAFWLALIYGLATPVFAYSNGLFQHQIAAFGAFVGFYLLWRVIYERATYRWLWFVGVLFGLVAISEYPVVPFIGFIFLWAVYKMPNRLALGRVVLGAIPLGLLFAAYNFAIFHTPLPVGYEYSTNWQEVHSQGFMSLTSPNFQTFLGLTISPFRGLFFIAPVLLLAVPGLVLMWRRHPEYRSITVLLTIIITGFLLYNSSSVMWWGGNAVGPRYLVPMIPFMSLPIIFAFNWLLTQPVSRLIVVFLALLSLFNVWTQAIAGQYLPPSDVDGVRLQNPLVDYSLPLLTKGDIARNYGIIFLGLPGILSLIPLITGVLAIYLLVPRLLDRRIRPRAPQLEQATS